VHYQRLSRQDRAFQAPRERGRQDWAPHLPSIIARERQRSAESGHRSRSQLNIPKGGLGSFEADTRDGLSRRDSCEEPASALSHPASASVDRLRQESFSRDGQQRFVARRLGLFHQNRRCEPIDVFGGIVALTTSHVSGNESEAKSARNCGRRFVSSTKFDLRCKASETASYGASRAA
jgi:hypothetical protein